jgi:ribosomal protein S18 acetylase RimI-like enzyme
MMLDITHRLITHADTDVLVAILTACFGDEFLEMKEVYIESLKQPSCVYLILLCDVPIGSFEVKRDSMLASFCVLPAFQHRGIGTKLLTELKKQYPDLYVGSVTEMSKALYERLDIPLR